MKLFLQGIILSTLTLSTLTANDFETPKRPSSNATYEAVTPEKSEKTNTGTARKLKFDESDDEN